MHRRCMSYRARSTLREAREADAVSNEFVPALSVRRPVLLDDGNAELAHETLERNIKKRLRARKSRYVSVVPADQWSVTLVEKGKLIRGFRETETQPTAQDMWALAGALRQVLGKLLRNEPRALPLPLGDPGLFGDSDPKRSAGVPPLGWKGSRGRYAAYDELQRRNPLDAIVVENELCVQAITNLLPLSEERTAETLSPTPHVSVVRSKDGIRAHDFRAISEIIDESLPEELMLGDPVIYLHPSRSKLPAEEVTIRPSTGLPAT